MKKCIKTISLLLIFSIISCNKEQVASIQKEVKEFSEIERVEPPNWWLDFENKTLQLLVKHPNIAEATPTISYEGIAIEKVHKAASKNYMFIDIKIASSAKAGKFNIIFTFKDGTKKIHTYELKSRKKPADEYLGFNSSDAIYLITPDRFANGDESNDINTKLNETTIDRTGGYARHGGDIKGIINHLDYISELGYTAIWSTPLLTNNMFRGSYHGYAITDLYQIDPRFGTLNDYLELSQKLKEKGMKLIMDQVANHCGLEHWWMKDLPFKDWVNNQKNYEENIKNWDWKKNIGSNHRRTTNQDLYASEIDKNGMADGWFVSGMPDLNQRNPFMARYIIQNSIWWIETAELGGIRQDTYPYPDKKFMSDWAGAIIKEYPNFSIVGEEWSYNPLLIGYWQKGAKNKDGYESNLTATMDFAMQKNVVDALLEEESWDKGLVKIYEGLANDFHYASPKDIMIFPGNHDMSRIYTQLKEDPTHTKMALATYLILPRTPQVYYGTEILMDDSANPGDHGLIRTDFPGGWKGDTINAFTGEGLTSPQKEMQSFLKTLLNYRKNSKAIHKGRTVHFSPFMGTYFLFRILNDEIVALIINKNDKPITIDLKRYAEIGLEGKSLKNIITKEKVTWENAMKLTEKGPILLTTKLNK